jgi:hypothetical protein
MRVSLIILILGILELIFKIFRCALGEYYSLFWIHLLFLIALFYWPQYVSGRFSQRTGLFSGEFRLFLSALIKAAYYLLFVAVIFVLILFIFRKAITDSMLFLPLLLFWPIYVFEQTKPNFKRAIIPFTISMVTMVAIQLTNPANPKLETFNAYLKDFEAVVSMVKNGEIKPDQEDAETRGRGDTGSSLTTFYPSSSKLESLGFRNEVSLRPFQDTEESEAELPCQYRHLVGCPNRKIRIESSGKAKVIYFCNELKMWGAGREDFVYRSDGKDISVKSVGNGNLEIRKLRNNWFWKVEKFDSANG